MNPTELAATLSTLGDDALAAFLFVEFLDFFQFLIFIGFAVWGIRTAWNAWKENNFRS